MPLNLPYYYGHSGEQYAFFRIPKLLLTDDRFAEISTDAGSYGVVLSERLDRRAESRLYYLYSGGGHVHFALPF